MEIKIKCSCGQVLKVGTESAGKTGKCPACEGNIRIPTLEEIEEARKTIPQPVEIPEDELELEEEVDGGAEEEEEEKPSTRRLKAPTRSKTRSKMLADVRDTKEDRKKTRTRKAEEGGKRKGKGKKRGKTRGGRRGKTSVIDKYKRKGRGGEDDEGEYVAQKKSPLKLLIVVGVVIVGGLVAVYALHWGPMSKARNRTEDYIELMNALVKDVRERIIERYENKVPGNLDDYKSWLSGIKETADEVDKTMTPAMKQAYDADDLMHKMLDILSKEAVTVITDRNDARMAHEFNEEKNKEYIKSFGDKLQKVNAIAEDIKNLVKSVEISMRR